MPTKNPQKFAELLIHGIYSIKVQRKKSITTIQDELGYAINREGGSPIIHWRRGHVPTDISEIEGLAQEIVREGNLDRMWLIDFLTAAGVQSDTMVQKLFPDNINRPEKQPNATHSLDKISEPNRTYPHFVGRVDELEILCQWLQSDEVRVISISGMSGIGKTSLAIEAGHRNRLQFRDGIVHVSLREVIPFDLRNMALAVLTKLFGPKLEFGEQPTSTLHYYLQNSALLLILDDLQLISTDALHRLTAQIRNQLPEVGVSKAILISHARIPDLEGWYFSRYLSVKQGLEFEPFLKLVEYHIRVNRLNLKLSAVRQVFDAIYGHPKLLELAIGKAKDIGWEKVLSMIPRMKDNFLATQVINSFNQRLPIDIQTVLRSISIFPTTTCTLEELSAAVPTIPNVRTYLEQLLEAHLVDFQPNSSLYSIHQLIADTNIEHVDLDTHDSTFFQARIYLTEFYIQELQKSSYISSIQTFLLENAIGIVRWCADKALCDLHVRLVLVMVEMLKVKGTYTEAITMLSYALQSAQLLENPQYIADLQFYLGEFSYQLGDHRNCAYIFNDYVNSAKRESSKQADALHRLAILHAYPRNHLYCQVETVQALEECYQLRQKLGEQLKAAYALNDLGYELFCRGDKQQATQFISKSLEIAKQSPKNSINDLQTWGIILRTTAIYYRDSGEFDIAKSFYEQSIDALEQTDNLKELADTYISYASTSEILKDFDSAMSALSNSLQLLKRLGPSQILAQAWLYLGEVCTSKNTATSLDKAENAYQNGLEIAQWLPSGEEDGISYISQYGLGRIQSRKGKFESALQLLQASLEVRERLGHREGIPFVLYEMAVAKIHLNQQSKALEFLDQVIAMTNSAAHHREQAIYKQAQVLKAQIE